MPSLYQEPVFDHASTRDSIDIFDVLIALAKRKLFILIFVGVACIAAVIVSILQSSIYTSRTSILPPQQTQSKIMAMAAQLSPLTGLAGNGGRGEVYVSMLKSRTAADGLIERFGLKAVYQAKNSLDARSALEDRTKITLGKDGLITVEVEDRDPRLAADIANGYAEELQKLDQNLAVTEAAQRRLYLGRQLQSTKEELSRAEVALREVQERTGMIQPAEQGKAIVEAIANLQAQIVAREIRLRAIRLFATEQNPEFVQTQTELAELRAQLTKLERSSGGGTGDIQVATAKIPEVGMQYLRCVREVKYQETLFEALAKQYELARLDEARDGGVIQVLDKAVPAEQRTRPKRTLMVVLTAVTSLLLSCMLALLLEVKQSAEANPEIRMKVEKLVRSFRQVPTHSS